MYICLIIICIPSETISKATHKYHSCYLCLFNLCSHPLYRKQDHWTFSSAIKERSVIAIIRTISTPLKDNLAIWQEAAMEGNSDFVSFKVQSVHMAAALTGCLLRVSPFETGGENKLQMPLFRGRGQGYMGLIFLLHCENQSQTLTFSAQLLVFCASTHRDLLWKRLLLLKERECSAAKHYFAYPILHLTFSHDGESQSFTHNDSNLLLWKVREWLQFNMLS